MSTVDLYKQLEVNNEDRELFVSDVHNRCKISYFSKLKSLKSDIQIEKFEKIIQDVDMLLFLFAFEKFSDKEIEHYGIALIDVDHFYESYKKHLFSYLERAAEEFIDDEDVYLAPSAVLESFIPIIANLKLFLTATQSELEVINAKNQSFPFKDNKDYDYSCYGIFNCPDEKGRRTIMSYVIHQLIDNIRILKKAYNIQDLICFRKKFIESYTQNFTEA